MDERLRTFESFLHFSGERVTRHRLAAAHTALTGGGVVEPRGLVRTTNRSHPLRIGTATAWRTLDLLVEARLAQPYEFMRAEDGKLRALRFLIEAPA